MDWRLGNPMKDITITRERLQQFVQDKFPLRPLGKPIHKPTEKDRVAQIPLEWKSFEVEQ